MLGRIIEILEDCSSPCLIRLVHICVKRPTPYSNPHFDVSDMRCNLKTGMMMLIRYLHARIGMSREMICGEWRDV